MRWMINNDTMIGGLKGDSDEISWDYKTVKDYFNIKEEI